MRLLRLIGFLIILAVMFTVGTLAVLLRPIFTLLD